MLKKVVAVAALAIVTRNPEEGTTKTARTAASSPTTIDDTVRARAASRTHAVPVIYLHGARGLAAKGCPWMRPGASDVGVLVCPEAIVPAEGGTWSWGSDVSKQAVVVDDALAAARAAGASTEPGVAVGFSQGSYVALDLVKTGRAKFRGLVLIGAEMHPSAERLHAAGVTRIVLAAGSQDAAYASMKEEAAKMANATAGLEVRFVDLGHVGHTYAAEDTDALRDAIAWAAGS